MLWGNLRRKKTEMKPHQCQASYSDTLALPKSVADTKLSGILQLASLSADAFFEGLNMMLDTDGAGITSKNTLK